MTAKHFAKRGAPDSGDLDPILRRPHRFGPDWRERIEIAREARDQARKVRGGQPMVFPVRRRSP